MTVYVFGDVEYHPDEEVCPWCGGFFAELVAWSGWCGQCTAMFVGQGEPTAHCSACDTWKPVAEFGKKVNGKLRSECRRCDTDRRRRWREANPEREAEVARQAYERKKQRKAAGTVAA